jgi:circadian clock protein KaiB
VTATPTSAAELEEARARAGGERYVLRLYVCGMSARSRRAVEAVRALCDTHLRGRHDLTIVDLYQEPAAARREQVVATPTLVKSAPVPLRRLIGDLTDEARVLAALGIAVA